MVGFSQKQIIKDPLPTTIGDMSFTSTIEIKYFKSLAQFFSQPVITALCKNEMPDWAKYVLKESQFLGTMEVGITFGQFFDLLYSWLGSNYRCEYLYKNLLANEILGARHLPSSTLLTEFRVDECKADIVILNGTSSVYEIKTELDSFARLSRQLEAYRKVFDKIYLVLHHTLIEKVPSFVDPFVGLICLTEEGKLITIREAFTNKENTDSSVIFDCLRQNEYLQILSNIQGSVPNVPNTKLYRECRRLAATIPTEQMHDAMVEVLRKRISGEKANTAHLKIPPSLRLLYLERNFNKRDHQTFLSTLDSPFHTN